MEAAREWRNARRQYMEAQKLPSSRRLSDAEEELVRAVRRADEKRKRGKR